MNGHDRRVCEKVSEKLENIEGEKGIEIQKAILEKNNGAKNRIRK